MSNPWQAFGERLKTLGGDWTQYSVIGSFLLYVVGYLTLRFHLTAMGIATDLTVVDERYLFAGARFAVYLVSTVPSIVLIALPVALAFWLIGKLLPAAVYVGARRWLMHAPRLVLLGIVFCVFMIQFVMRQCFQLNNLLLAERLPAEPAWLIQILHDDAWKAPYFSLLVVSCLISLAIVRALAAAGATSGWVYRGRMLLAFLTGVQILFLPINYGVLIADKSLARVTVAGARPLAAGEHAWLVWEGKEGITFLLRSADGRDRSLITQPRAQAATIDVVGFDAILPALFDKTGAKRLTPAEVKP